MNKNLSSTKLYFIENLTFISWLFYIFPYLIRGDSYKNHKNIYYIDATRWGLFVAGITLRLINSALEKLQFRLIDIRDETGTLVRLRITYKDLAEVRNEIVTNPLFQQFLNGRVAKNRLAAFLIRKIPGSGIRNSTTLWRALFIIQVVAWKRKKLQHLSETILFLERRPWFQEIKNYACRYAVEIIPAKNISIKNFMPFLPIKDFLKKIIYRFYLKDKQLGPSFDSLSSGRLAVNYYGLLNLERPELNSDLFFWRYSKLSGKDIIITLTDTKATINESDFLKMKENGIIPVAFSYKAKKNRLIPIFYHWPKKRKISLPKKDNKYSKNLPEYKWLIHQLGDYHRLFDYWSNFFTKYNIRIYLTWYKYDATHYVIADALGALGGITAIYQRAFEEFSSVETIVNCDIEFGFSKKGAELKQQSGSKVAYYVVMGFLGDYRFPLLKEEAQRVRKKLKDNGAEYILAFFDENSADDVRWHTGHEFMREHYAFLLEKVLSEPWLGLVLKPKAPSTLRRRLGGVAELLSRAEARGRCFVFEGGLRHSFYPPAVAALASDIAIHVDLSAATAGVESALAGIPTLLLDREGWPISGLYRLGRGRVVFNDWLELWDACKDYWGSPSELKGFGDWSSMLDEIDPFRDGRAAERMGIYLKWLLDGLKAGLPRDPVMADAAERYSKIWGKDKVIQMKP